MVEFAMVSLILVLLVVGIVNFGLLLSFKQDVTRAAAEGARAGAVALHTGAAPTDQTGDDRYQATVTGTQDAVAGFGEICGSGGLTCNIQIHDCDEAIPDASYWDNGQDDCVTVELVYDYENFPKFTEPPVLSGALPNEVRAESVARLND